MARRDLTPDELDSITRDIFLGDYVEADVALVTRALERADRLRGLDAPSSSDGRTERRSGVETARAWLKSWEANRVIRAAMLDLRDARRTLSTREADAVCEALATHLPVDP